MGGWDAGRSAWLALQKYQRSGWAPPETHSANDDAALSRGEGGDCDTKWPPSDFMARRPRFLRLRLIFKRLRHAHFAR